jgi:hypothetical protein
MDKSLTRSEMLDLVRSVPMRTLAAKVGLSDVGLRKAILGAGLPVPPKGHWNRVLAGRPTQKKPTLPRRGFGASDRIWLRGEPSFLRKLDDDEAVPKPPVFDETMEDVRRRAQRAIGKVRATRDLSSPHPAIRRVLDDEAKRAEKLKESPYLRVFYGPRFDAPLGQRRLRILNAISLALSKAGLEVRLASKEDAALQIFTNAASLPLTAQETKKGGARAEKENRLSVLAGGGSDHRISDALARWDDTKERKLETLIGEIAFEVAVLLEQRYRQNEVRCHEELLQRRAADIESRRQEKIEAEIQERERLKKMEQDRIDRLLADADRFRRSETIRAYVQAAGRHSDPEARKAFERWRIWALALANQLDPIGNGSFLRSMEEASSAGTSDKSD